MPFRQASREQTFVLASLLCCAALLSGCGIDPAARPVSATSALKGTVHGGQQPVSGALIQLYTVGGAGNGSAATPMLTSVVTTLGDGTFDLGGRYTCGKSSLGATIGSPSNQVYLVATGGNPGLTPAVANPALSMVTALGTCANLSEATYVEVNEITTAAAAWALAPFTASVTRIGASSTNVLGIDNAFLDASLLADTGTGLPATLPANLTVETGKLISLANSLASCVNSDGTTGCAPLFQAATPASTLIAPADTFAAALNIVTSPANKVEAVYQATSGTPPFSGGLATWPNDWTMSLSVSGGGMLSPTALAIDAASNVWVVGQNGPLSAFNAQGTPLSATGYGAGVLDKSQGIAIDTHGDVWVTDYNAPFNGSGSIGKFLGVNSTATGPVGTVVMSGGNPGFTNGVYFPFAVAADTDGTMFVANTGNGTVTALNPDGSIYINADSVSGYQLGGLFQAFPNAVAADLNHGFWIPDGNAGVIHVSADGASKSTPCCNSPFGVATDSLGNVWVASLLGNSISEVDATGTLQEDQLQVAGLQNPEYVALDAAQNVWVSNNGDGSISEIAGNGGSLTPGTPISPTVGTYTRGGFGLDAGLSEPNFIAPDRSGNIWVGSERNNKIVMFFGLATPTITPTSPAPTAP